MSLKKDIDFIRKVLMFMDVAQSGQFKESARNNGYKQSNLSNYIKDFEDELGVSLLNRHQSGISMTNDGKEVFEIACEISNALNKIRGFKSAVHDTKGDIRLWAGDGIITGYIIDHLNEFYEQYPQISIDITCSVSPPNLIHNTDIGVVYEEPTQKNSKIVLKNDMVFGLFASKEYLQKYGFPKSLDDIIENHRICTRVNYSSVWKKWQEILKSAKHICLSTSSSSTLISATKSGIGIALHPLTIKKHEKNLIHLSKVDLTLAHPFWIITHEKTHELPKIKALLKHLQKI